MRDLTNNEMRIYTKILNNKWDEIEDLVEKEDMSNPMLVLGIFSAKKWDIALKLLKANSAIDLNKIDKATSNTLLMMAIADNTISSNNVAKFLIDNNAKLDLINKKGLTALMVACRENNLEMFKYLLQHNDDINVITHKKTLLMSAIEGGNVEIVREVAQKSSNLNMVIDGENALSFAIKNKKFEIANMLIYMGITVPNQDIVEHYLMSTRDINLIYNVLTKDTSNNELKDRLMKDLINVCPIQDLLKVGDIHFRENLVSVFLNGRHNFYEQKQAIEAFLKSDVKDYINANFKDNIRAFLIDCYVQRQPQSYINSMQNEWEIQDYPNHFEQILNSTGMSEEGVKISLNKYFLALCQRRIYQDNIEDFSLNQNEMDVIIAYNLIDSMEDSEFKERYKEFYFDNILSCDKEILERLNGQNEGMINSVYNWFWGIKDDMRDLNKDIYTISTNGLITYNIDNLEGFKRMSNDNKIWAKDTLYYSIMSIEYLADKIIDANKINLASINDLLNEKDDNLSIIQAILNDDEIEMPEGTDDLGILSQNNMNYVIDNEYVFVRGIVDAYKYTSDGLHNETYADVELRKGFRTKGQPTLTKKQSYINGNINRSCTLINFGTRLFASVGLGFIKDNSDKISLVASRNVVTGKGRKRELTRKVKEDSFIDPTKSIDGQLCELLEYLKRGGGKDGHNEVIFHLKYPEDVSFIYYSSKNGTLALDFLNAVYVQRKYEANTGKRLPIFQIAQNWHYPIRREYTRQQIEQALREVFFENTSDILDKNSLDFLLSFKDELKAMPDCSLKIRQFLKCETPDNIYQMINIAKLIGAYQSYEKQNEYLSKHTNILIGDKNFMPFVKERLRKKDDARRKNRSVGMYLEIMDDISKMASPEVMDDIKSVSQDTLKKVCEYGIKRNDITSIDYVLEECANRPYLALDDETKRYIAETMEDKQKQRIEFCKQYNISL